MSASPTPSRTLPITLMSIGAALLALSAFLWFLGPKLFVEPLWNAVPEMTEDDMFYETIQSGQPAELPGNFEMTVMPQWVWSDPAFNESMMNGGEPDVPEYACTVQAPDGSMLDSPVDDGMMGAEFLTTEAGSYLIECDQGGMLEVNGQNAELNEPYQAAESNLNRINWGTFLSLLLGVGLLTPGAYLLGVRTQQKRATDEATLAMLRHDASASAPLNELEDTGSSLERASAATPDSAPSPASPGRTLPRSRESFDPNAPHNSQSFEVRPRATRPKPKRDPFDED